MPCRALLANDVVSALPNVRYLYFTAKETGSQEREARVRAEAGRFICLIFCFCEIGSHSIAPDGLELTM